MGRVAGPGKSDPGAGSRPHPLFPILDVGRRRREIGSASGNIFHRRAEHIGQAHKWAVQVEWRERLMPSGDVFDAWDAGKESLQVALTSDDHFSAALRDQWRIAYKLDCVAETLLGVKDDAASGELTSIPARHAV